MSWYYNYTIGYKKEGKIYPLGPFDNKGKLCDVVSKSRSFASDLYESFVEVGEEMISDELRKQFEYEDFDGEKKIQVYYMPYIALPKGDYIKKGYFLISDIEEYEKSHDTYDLFYDYMTPEIYLKRLTNELKFGKPAIIKDCEGVQTEISCANYAYYAYPDYLCKEYEVSVIREAAHILNSEYDYAVEELVVLMTQG